MCGWVGVHAGVCGYHLGERLIVQLKGCVEKVEKGCDEKVCF